MTIVSTSARRGTLPPSEPLAKNFGRWPSRPRDAARFANAGMYTFITPTAMIAAITATTTGPTPGKVSATMSMSGTWLSGLPDPSAPTVTTCSDR